MAQTFGEMVREARIQADLSLRQLAEELDVSHVYLGEVERGKRRSLPPRHWDRLVELLPTLTVADLREAAERSKSVTVDPLAHTGQVRDLAITLARKLATDEVGEAQARDILRILKGEDD